MSPILGVILAIVWLYILRVLKKSSLPAWRFVWGSCGLFVLMMIFVRPYLTQPLAQMVAAVAGGFGKITGLFSSYFKYGVIFVDSKAGAISLLIDFECSGILEVMAYVSLLAFFEAYTRYERIIVGVLGVAYIILANAVRIISICVIIYFFGMPSYYIAHTFAGRFIFYGLSIVLYFFVFTKAQIIRQKVGGFTYGINK
ncbi:MAG: exosortase family protein XrtG [Lachnospiraceae bacterium]|nr:exosortase family protein XrtG [Lachnospiraceae bacterium]